MADRAGEDGRSASLSWEQDANLNLDELFLPVKHRPLRRMPHLLRGALALVWRAAPREFCLSGALQLLAAVGLAGQVLVGREALARIVAIGESSTAGDAVPWLVVLAVMSAIVAFANMARVELQRLVGELVARYATSEVLGVATAVELLAFDSSAFHDRLQRARVNAMTRPMQMSDGVLGVLSALVTIAGIAGALLLLEPLFLVFVVFAYIPLWLITKRASKVIYEFTVKQTERDRRRDYLTYVLTRREEAAEVRAFRLGDHLLRRFQALYDERIEELRTVVRRRLRLGIAGSLVSSLLTALSVTILVLFLDSGRLDVAEAGAAAAAIVLLGQRLQVLAGSTGGLYESSLFVEDFSSFVEAAPALRTRQTAGEPAAPFTSLVVDRVTFRYPSQVEPALDSVSMEIRRGEVVALVGENGSGKTTLAKLLAALYRPSSGSISWDGVDISAYNDETLRQSVGIIFQDFIQYMLSARENVTMGCHERADDDEALFEATRRASAHDFLARLSDGYETQLGTEFYGGSNLSTGQWQRVALARAFFRDAPFLILDEPSASLDPRSEAKLFDNIRTLYEGRTVLLISHRFSSVRNADRIYVLSGGRIVESGRHEELMAAHGLYAELFTLQAAAFLDPLPSDG